MAIPSVAVVDDPSFDEHYSEAPHPERPERLEAARSGLAAGLGDIPIGRVEVREGHEEALYAHSPEYLRQLTGRCADGFGQLDADTFFSPGSLRAALRAAGGAAELARLLATGRAQTGFALLRPPGHHARPDRPMGFCLLNNVAVAARAAQVAGARRVAILDWDVHHGNGTQEIFYEDPAVLYISLHQWPLYPGTGRPDEIGDGSGRGTTVNVGLPAGSGDVAFAEAFRRIVVPALDRFGADVHLVSAGYDAHTRDPLAELELEAASYQALASALIAAFPERPIGFFLEGGYDLAALEGSVRATARAISEPLELATGRLRAGEEAALAQTLAAHPWIGSSS